MGSREIENAKLKIENRQYNTINQYFNGNIFFEIFFSRYRHL